MSAFFERLRRVAPLRLLLLGFPVLIGFGLTMAFHHEYRKGRLFAYSPVVDVVVTLLLCAALTGLYALLVRWLERRWPQELALAPGSRWAGLGLLAGFGMFSAVYAVFALLGLLDFQGLDPQAALGPILLLSVVAGIGEELLFRGVLFRVVEDSLGTTVAVIVSAAFFGLAHAGNPNATLLSSVAIALEAGVMLALAFAWTRNLWFVMGLHAAWNFTEGGLYGAPVSGISEHGLLRIAVDPHAPQWLTGGAFGPEASVVALAVCMAAALLFLRAALQRGQWKRRSLRLILSS
jgi:membrane protease YdiL (CAAX protease family)